MIPAVGLAVPRTDTMQLSGANGVAASRMTGVSPASSAAAGTDFASVLSKVASDAMGTVQSAETTSIKGMNGQATTQAVVDSVMAAERTLQTAVSLRDKAVSAYMELSRMQI